MDGYFRKTILLALSIVLAFGFPACSGKGNGSTTNKRQVGGKVLKGYVQNASVQIYTLNAQRYRDTLIGSGTTGPDGSFSVQADDSAGPLVLIVASGGDYVDEATGQRVSIPSWWELSALTPWPSDYTRVNLTPLTRMATEQALSRMSAGESPLTALENAKRNVANAFGLTGVDINQTEPADLTTTPSVRMERGNAEVEYGLVLAALSQMTVGEGLPPSQTLSLIQNVVDDLSDGKIDDVGRNGGDLPNILTATPSHIINGVPGASNDFLRGSRNASGISGAESPTYTQAQEPIQPSHPRPPSGGGGGGGGSGLVCSSGCGISGACSSHLGMNCSAGPDSNGFVICNDGTSSPTVQYSCSGTPTGVTAVAGDTSVTVSWNAVAGATSYKVYYSSVSGTGASGAYVSSVASPKIVTGLANGVAYYFVVSSVSSTVENSASLQVSATPSATIVPGPTFTDANLASCVTAAQAASGLTSAISLTTLDCPNRSISNLSGIEALTNLVLLSLGGNVIVDVTPVASLTSLAQLDLSNNRITTGVGALAVGLVNLGSVVIHCEPALIISGDCSDTNALGIPCAQLQSLITNVMARGGVMSVVQPSTAQSGRNCT